MRCSIGFGLVSLTDTLLPLPYRAVPVPDFRYAYGSRVVRTASLYGQATASEPRKGHASHVQARVVQLAIHLPVYNRQAL